MNSLRGEPGQGRHITQGGRLLSHFGHGMERERF
jgi:hypothetical protein